ncbi:MAG: methionine adenosyltransferase [Candidatus Marinamargulisbacteria bacterium]|jgi:S-adenosylmethionine synthetase|nr:methionine adenosyltransferase [bacterium]MDG2265014.1 methionine adenosyltransferase [Candidatus Marinamargulisbacteria bacterium]|tara:strand:+ start:5160 stop:6314 length:1155 start_codon:yes stop_codon:yes gene_type:complete
MHYLFTSESVSEGHPDKICDQLSDSILDACLAQDPASRVAAECFISNDLVLVGGEITTTATLDIEQIVRAKLAQIGYTNRAIGIDANQCTIQSVINQQSADIHHGITHEDPHQLGAGDQGLMFGYACSQTPELMPLPIMLSHKLVHALAKLRHSGAVDYLLPDAKSQVTVEYSGNTPVRIHTVVISTQHTEAVDTDTLTNALHTHIFPTVLPKKLVDDTTRFLINPSGRFVIGGPKGDAGLTGRKIIVDTYGGWARHGGGAFSGKDASKVDRSVAYMARYIAKNLVAAGLATHMEIQLAYAIGIADPVSIHVTSDSQHDTDALVALIRDTFDLTPAGIIRTLSLCSPIFSNTAVYGHFGRDEFTWEQTNKVAEIQQKLAPAYSR